MKRFVVILLAGSLLFGCKEIDIPTYNVADTALCFAAQSSQFSMKGLEEDYMKVEIPVTLIGPVSSVDRHFKVDTLVVEGSTAVKDMDFSIEDAVVEADALSGHVTLLLRKFRTGVTKLRTTLRIYPSEDFKEGYPSYIKTVVEWSEEYVRPEEGVWRYWYTFFCKGYSRNLHATIVKVFGPEIETYTGGTGYVKTNPNLVMKMPTWWYEASRTLYQYVKQYDAEHPDAPLMHSDDCESYSSYLTAVGEGKKPEKVPTLLETLLTL